MRPHPIVFALLTSLAASAAAHDLWVQPAHFAVAGAGEPLDVGLMVGYAKERDPVDYAAVRVERFVASDGSREIPIAGENGAIPAGKVALPSPGLWTLGYRSFPSYVTLEAAKFEEYLKEEGLDAVLDARKRQGEQARKGVEAYSRCAKALVRVGPKPPHDPQSLPPQATLGFTLELIPEHDPTALAPGDELPVRLLLRGKPLEGALVEAIRLDVPEWHAIGQRSDADGRVRFRLPEAGTWMVATVAMEKAKRGEHADWASLWASLTFELPPAAASQSTPGGEK